MERKHTVIYISCHYFLPQSMDSTRALLQNETSSLTSRITLRFPNICTGRRNERLADNPRQPFIKSTCNLWMYYTDKCPTCHMRPLVVLGMATSKLLVCEGPLLSKCRPRIRTPDLQTLLLTLMSCM